MEREPNQIEFPRYNLLYTREQENQLRNILEGSNTLEIEGDKEKSELAVASKLRIRIPQLREVMKIMSIYPGFMGGRDRERLKYSPESIIKLNEEIDYQNLPIVLGKDLIAEHLGCSAEDISSAITDMDSDAVKHFSRSTEYNERYHKEIIRALKVGLTEKSKETRAGQP